MVYFFSFLPQHNCFNRRSSRRRLTQAIAMPPQPATGHALPLRTLIHATVSLSPRRVALGPAPATLGPPVGLVSFFYFSPNLCFKTCRHVPFRVGAIPNGLVGPQLHHRAASW